MPDDKKAKEIALKLANGYDVCEEFDYAYKAAKRMAKYKNEQFKKFMEDYKSELQRKMTSCNCEECYINDEKKHHEAYIKKQFIENLIKDFNNKDDNSTPQLDGDLVRELFEQGIGWNGIAKTLKEMFNI